MSFWDWLTTTVMSVVVSHLDAAGQPRSLQLHQGIVLGAQVGQVLGPRLGDVVVHAHRSGLVEAHVHGLAGEAAAHEVADEVPGHGAEPFGPGEQRELAPEAPGELALGVVVELGLRQQVGQLVGEVVVDGAFGYTVPPAVSAFAIVATFFRKPEQ